MLRCPQNVLYRYLTAEAKLDGLGEDFSLVAHGKGKTTRFAGKLFTGSSREKENITVFLIRFPENGLNQPLPWFYSSQVPHEKSRS